VESYVQVIRLWAGLVWADGVVTAREAEAMRRLIDGADLTDSERKTALGFLEQKVELGEIEVSGLAPSAREGIYRAALKLSAIDNDMADEELDFLGKLRAGLGIDEATAERIVDAVAAGK
jgi:hypothetical protein